MSAADREGELLPEACPFCAKFPKVHLAKVQHCQLHGEPYQDTIVKCCVVEVRAASRRQAIEIWNRRAAPGSAKAVDPAEIEEWEAVGRAVRAVDHGDAALGAFNRLRCRYVLGMK